MPFDLNSYYLNVHGKQSKLWILDICANDQISHNISSFLDYKNIVPISINFPDGSQVTASMPGIVVVSSCLTSHNVLYIPKFHVNLIPLPSWLLATTSIYNSLLILVKFCRTIPRK